MTARAFASVDLTVEQGDEFLRLVAASRMVDTPAPYSIQVESNTTGRDTDLVYGPASTTYACPVCFFEGLLRPPEDHLICPRCGTEFGYDDTGHTHAELGAMWRADRHQWRERAREAMKRDAAIEALFEEMVTAYECAVDDWVEGHPDRDRMIAMRIAEWRRRLAAVTVGA